ncbi:MAG: hypothetical protein JSS66_13370 [Armatimonadetes bacterium]|nr:hypothetical protein [Armatimonadota bacterium]
MKSGSKTRGALLTEVMFAIAIALVCALLFAATMPVANRSRAKADMMNRAIGLAQKELEAMKGVDSSLNPTTLKNAGILDSEVPVSPNKYSFTNADTAAFDNPAKVLPNGKGTVTIELIDIELRRVVVEVTWKENGKDRSYKVGTLVANLGN